MCTLFNQLGVLTVGAEPPTAKEKEAIVGWPNWVASAGCTSSGGGNGGTVTPGSGVPDDQLPGSTPEEKVWNYLISLGFTPVQAAGAMGNISRESGFDPQNIQDPAGRSKDPAAAGSGGWGLIQFTPGSSVLESWAPAAHVKATKDNVYFISTQLDIVYGYMKNSTGDGGGNMWEEYKAAATTPTKAADAFESQVENAGVVASADRQAAAEAAMAKYGNGPGADATITGGNATTGTDSSGCTCSSAAPADGSGVIMLDPGHSTFSDQSSRNALTGLYDTDTTGAPDEMHGAWVAANKIKPLLEKKGYTVKLTKNSENENISLSQRAERANSANAALLFTIHADSSVRWLAYPDKDSERTPEGSARADGKNGLVHPDIMEPSKAFAEKMAPIIAGGISKGGDPYDAVSFADYYGSNGLAGNGLNNGNTPVQTILSSVPEVYSEVSPGDLASDGFAQAVTEAISAAVKPAAGAPDQTTAPVAETSNTNCSAGGAVSGDLLSTVKNYAWPSYHSAPYVTMRPAYKQAVQKAISQGRYVGGTIYPGIDCGGFVTTAMIDSGYEPSYNFSGKGGATGTSPSDPGTQWNWLAENWQKIDPHGTQDLQPGDVAINSDHTYMYVGKIPGFDSVIASASWDTRAPMAGHETPGDPAFSWYRKK